MKINKTLIFVMTLIVLIIGISAVSAADIDNNTDASSAVSVSSVSSQASDVSDVASIKETKTIKSEAKTVNKEDKKVNEKTTKKSLKTDDTTTDNSEDVISVTKDNVNNYFTNDSINYKLENVEGKTVILDSSVPEALNTYQTVIIGNNCTLSGGNNNVTFTNHKFILDGSYASNVILSNMTLTFNQNATVPDDWTKDIDLLYITGNINATIKNVTISGTSDNESMPEESHYFICTNINNGTATFINTTVDTTIPSDSLVFDMVTFMGQPKVIPVLIQNGNTNFINSSISMKESKELTQYAPTIEMFYILGNNSNFINNSFYMECLPEGVCYLYGAYLSSSSNNTFIGNNITAKGTKYTNGLYFSSDNYKDNLIANNIITLTSGDSSTGGIAEDSSYGINVEDPFTYSAVKPSSITVSNITIINNTVITRGYNPYAIELYGAVGNSSIINNTIISTGHTPSGITAMAYNLTVDSNNITIIGETNQTESSADYFKPTTTGIHFQYGLNNTIQNNKIDVTNGTAIQFTASERNGTIKNNDIFVKENEIAVNIAINSAKTPTITDNSIIAIAKNKTVKIGDETVYSVSSSNATVENNTYTKRTTQITYNGINNATIDDTITISGKLIDMNNSLVPSNTTLTIKIGNDTYTTVTDEYGAFSLDCIVPHKAGTYDINVSYEGNEIYEQTETITPISILLKNPTVTLISDKLSGKKGDTITFIAQISDNDKIINQGYVSFKLNGITLIDANTGERNHIKVVNGIAQFEYTLPSYSGKDYNITVVYAGTDYNRTEDTGVLTIIKTNTYMNGNILSISPNGTATLNVKVFDEDNNLLDRNVKVSIKVNGITMLKEVTVANGSTNFDLTLLPSSKPYNITIITGENSNYMGSNTTVICHNTLPKINTTIDTTTSTSGNITAVNVNVKDVYGNAVSANPKVSIKVDGKTVISGQTAVNGVYTGNITTPTSGSHKLLVIAGETDSYASSRNETTITF